MLQICCIIFKQKEQICIGIALINKPSSSLSPQLFFISMGELFITTMRQSATSILFYLLFLQIQALRNCAYINK